MGVLLDTIRAEITAREQSIERLEGEVLQLREIETRAVDLDGAAAAGPASTPSSPGAAPVGTGPAGGRRTAAKAERSAKPRPAPAANRAGRDGLTPASQRALEVIRERGDIKSRDLADAVGIIITSVSRCVTPLLDRGLIRAEGSTNQRRYLPIGPPAPARDNGSEQQEPSADTKKREQIAGLGHKILTLIAENDGDLDEDGLCYGTSKDRDQVAEAVGRLLVDDKVTLNADGTYSLATAEQLAA